MDQNSIYDWAIFENIQRSHHSWRKKMCQCPSRFYRNIQIAHKISFILPDNWYVLPIWMTEKAARVWTPECCRYFSVSRICETRGRIIGRSKHKLTQDYGPFVTFHSMKYQQVNSFMNKLNDWMFFSEISNVSSLWIFVASKCRICVMPLASSKYILIDGKDRCSIGPSPGDKSILFIFY